MLIKEMVNFTKKTGVSATLQTLELMVPIIGKVELKTNENQGEGYMYDNSMLMMKICGENGSNVIFGNKSKSEKPIDGYDTEISVGSEKYYCVTEPKTSLDIAFQKIFALRGLHDVGLVYRDVKIANVMIEKENGEYNFLSSI